MSKIFFIYYALKKTNARFKLKVKGYFENDDSKEMGRCD